MKICDVAQFFSPVSGGVKRYLLDKQRFLERRPGTHHVLIVPSARDAVTRTGSSTVYEVASPRLIGSRSYRLLIARERILQIIDRERPDLIEVGDPYRTAWIGLEAGARLGVPVVAFYHSDFPRAIGRTLRRFGGGTFEARLTGIVQRYIVRLYNRMSATVVASSRLCATLAACGVERIVHVPLGTDVRAFSPQPSRARIFAELGLAPDAKLLLFVGRMAREKNIESLIGALDLLTPDLGPVGLLLVGDGELHGRVLRAAKHRANLTWWPHCESVQRLAEVYSAADLFVHPGRYETFGLVALEAQACGSPVVAVRGGGVEDTTIGERPRWLAVDGSAEALAACIERALRIGDTPEKRQARRARVQRQFSMEATFERMLALYAHLVAHGTLEGFLEQPLHDADLPYPALQLRRS